MDSGMTINNELTVITDVHTVDFPCTGYSVRWAGVLAVKQFRLLKPNNSDIFSQHRSLLIRTKQAAQRTNRPYQQLKQKESRGLFYFYR